MEVDENNAYSQIVLLLAKSIIEKCNGYIDVKSELEKGTIFTIKHFKMW